MGVFNYKLRVDSVGDIRALTSVRICEICGSFFNYKLRVKSVGEYLIRKRNLWENISAEKDLFSHALVLAILL